MIDVVCKGLLALSSISRCLSVCEAFTRLAILEEAGSDASPDLGSASDFASDLGTSDIACGIPFAADFVEDSIFSFESSRDVVLDCSAFWWECPMLVHMVVVGS